MCLNSSIFLNGRNGTERSYPICRQWNNNDTKCVETECSLNQKREFDSSVRLPYIRAATATKIKIKDYPYNQFGNPLPTLKTLRVHLVSFVRLRSMNSGVLGADYFSKRVSVPQS
jgi:hypothetical protein